MGLRLSLGSGVEFVMRTELKAVETDCLLKIPCYSATVVPAIVGAVPRVVEALLAV
jgi:hypothetical protein